MRVLVVLAAILCLLPPADAAKRKARGVAAPPPDPAGRVALLEAQPAPKVDRKLAQALTALAEEELKAAGLDVVSSKDVAAAYRKMRRKVPSCADDAQCLVEAAQLSQAAYATNLSFPAAGKNLGLKVTVVEADTGKVLSNILSFVAKPTKEALSDALRKQLARTVPVVKADVEEKKAVAAAKKAEAERLAAEKAAAEQAERERLAAEREARIQAEKERLAAVKAEQERRIAEEKERRRPKEKVVVEYEKPFRPLPFVVMGAGAVATGVGIGVFGLQAQSAVDDFKAGRNPEEAAARARSKALVADITAGAGIAMMLGGTAWWLFGGEPEPVSGGQVSISPSFNGVAVTGSF